MPVICSVVDCKTRMNKKDKGVNLYCFPKENSRYNPSLNSILANRRAAWIRALKRGEFTDDELHRMRVCSLHFVEGKPAKFQDVNHPDWVPTLNMGYSKTTPPSQQRLSRYERYTERSAEVSLLVQPVQEDDTVPVDLNRTIEIEVYTENIIEEGMQFSEQSNEEEMEFSEQSNEEEAETSLHNIEDQAAEIKDLKAQRSALKAQRNALKAQRDALKAQRNALKAERDALKVELQCIKDDLVVEKSECDAFKAELKSMQTELIMRNDEVYNLREKLKRFSLCSESFTKDKKLLFYTGIPSVDLFNVILKHLNSDSTKLSNLSNSLDSFQILLLVLMKLRLSTSFRGLGYRFDISERTASIIFQKGIVLMFHVLRKFIHWPSREELMHSVPQCFLDTFGKRVAVIIDCFKITIQKPASLKARAETFSQYKQRNTIKYLIGIAPCGAVTFISEGWGGRTSDKHLTENCGILDLLEPGDIVLADRGFTITQEVGLRYATLKTPSFTDGKPQLAPRALEESRKISSVRIHVERVIGTLRNKFKILNGPIPVALLKSKHNGNSIFDYTVIVCCALTNMCDSVVPL